MLNQGTPKNLLQAVTRFFQIPCSQMGEHPAVFGEKIVRDYLAQKFMVAHAKSSDPKSIEALWKVITGREWGQQQDG